MKGLEEPNQHLIYSQFIQQQGIFAEEKQFESLQALPATTPYRAEQATRFTGGPDLLYLGHFAMVHKNYSENNDYQVFRYIVIALTGITENAQKSYNRLATQVVQ